MTLLCIAGLAWAQEPAPLPGFDAHGFHLVAHDADLRDPLTVERPGAFDQLDWFAGGLAEYARAPLVRVTSSDAGDEAVDPLLDNLVAFDLSAGVAVHERLRFSILAPVYGLSTSSDRSATGPAMGDLRGTAMIVLVRPDGGFDGGGFGLGLVGNLDAPTGTPSRFLGAGDFGGGGKLAATYEWAPVTLTADFGAQFVPSVDLGNITGDDTLLAGLALGWSASDTVGLTLEANSQPPLIAPAGGYVTLPPIEGLLSVRYVSPTGAFWTAGAAAGFTDGPGVAAFRLFVGGGYGAREALNARDVDTVGVLKSSDLCPLEPETFNGWKDDDGCPDRLGTLGIDVRYHNQSRSADATITGPDGAQTVRIGPQGLALDAVPGSQWTVVATDGCLRGEASSAAAEGGGKLVVELTPVYDAKVRVEVVGPTDNPLSAALVAWRSDHPECVPPGTAMAGADGKLIQEVASGSHKIVVTASGHNVVEQLVDLSKGEDELVRIKLAASKIVVEQKQIRILEKVQFEFGKAVIRPESYGLLTEVATVILNNPGIGRVEVGGHTDNKGTEEFNLDLSRSRAAAVREYLIAQGVPPERLISVGYGESRPIDTNKTEQGREVNRRVEFKLIDHQDGGAQ